MTVNNDIGLGFLQDQVPKSYSLEYSLWRENARTLKRPFYMLYSGFEDYLPHLSTNAVRLYLYYAFRARNETGESFPALHTIAEALKVTDRSINNWNQDLIDLGLIKRENGGGHKSTTTYLLPTSDLQLTYEQVFQNQKAPEGPADYNHLKKEIEEFASATGQELTNILHLYQWRRGEEKTYDRPLHIMTFGLVRSAKITKKDKKTQKNMVQLIPELDRHCNILCMIPIKDTITTPVGDFAGSEHRYFEIDTKTGSPAKLGIAINSSFDLLSIGRNNPRDPKKVAQVSELVNELMKAPIAKLKANLKSTSLRGS